MIYRGVASAMGEIELEQIHAETGIRGGRSQNAETGDRSNLCQSTRPTAIAVKAQHAYSRTLNWIERNDVEASAALRQGTDSAGGGDQRRNTDSVWEIGAGHEALSSQSSITCPSRSTPATTQETIECL